MRAAQVRALEQAPVQSEEQTSFTLQEALAQEAQEAPESMFDDDVPYTPPKRTPKYSLHLMRPGQSQFFPGKEPKDLSSMLSRINNANQMYLVAQARTEMREGTPVGGCRVFCRNPEERQPRKPVVRRKKVVEQVVSSCDGTQEEVLKDLTEG